MDQRSDRELLAGHISGDATCFALLTERYAKDLYGFLYRFVGDGVIADDLVQEAFLQVHLAAGSFDLERPFKPWLYTIAANKARDSLRSRTRRSERSLDAVSGEDESGSALIDGLKADDQSTAERFDTGELREQVRGVIAKMPEHLRLILMLGYYQQLPYAEIAEILSIPVGTVKSRLHSAIGYFGRLWRHHTGESESDGSGEMGDIVANRNADA